MTARDPQRTLTKSIKTSVIASTLCKIAAVYLFITAAQGVSWISIEAFIITGDFSDLAIGLLMMVVPSTVAGILLWKFSDQIARVSEETVPAALSANLTTDDLLEAGVFLVGLYAVLFGLVDVIGIEAADWMARSMPDSDTDYLNHALTRNWTRRAGYLLQIILGVGLMYGRRSSVKPLSDGCVDRLRSQPFRDCHRLRQPRAIVGESCRSEFLLFSDPLKNPPAGGVLE